MVKKIPTLYRRDPANRARVIVGDVTPGCEWVIAGEGAATRKMDGVCTMLDNAGRWWARREVKPGATPPPGFVAIETDPATGKTVGWEPIEQSSFARYHAEARDSLTRRHPGTYELIGPRINGNPECASGHLLIAHGRTYVPSGTDLTPVQLIDYCRVNGWEGIVWWHPDGRMAKLKVRDLAWA